MDNLTPSGNDIPTIEPDPSAPYKEVTKDSYADAAAQSFTAKPTTGGIHLVGPCPRCGHTMEIDVVDDGIYLGTPEPNDPDTSSLLPMICTCTGTFHEGRAPDGFGCGAYWNLAIEQE